MDNLIIAIISSMLIKHVLFEVTLKFLIITCINNTILGDLKA